MRERCAWSRELTHEQLVPYLTEEAAEVIDAVEAGDAYELQEELGDVLWQVMLHATLASERKMDAFTIDDVANALADKMIHRHPHVFADAAAETPEEVIVHWNAAKAAEKRDRTSVLDGVPKSMPALARAQKILGKAASVGVSVDVDSPVALPAAGSQRRTPAARMARAVQVLDETTLGEQLLALVAVARANDFDAERALRTATRALEAEIRSVEASASSG